jgi:hypothetical protein
MHNFQVTGFILRDARKCALLRMRSPCGEDEVSDLMVRRRFFSAVSNHECPKPSFETRKSALLQDEVSPRSG